MANTNPPAVTTDVEEQSARYTPFIETDRAADSETLRARMNEHGYLFFRSLVPVNEVLETRRVVLELCRAAGWIAANANDLAAPVAPGIGPFTEGMPEYMAVYRQVLKAPRFHDFPTHPRLISIAAKLLDGQDEDVLVHPRRIGRMTFPHYIAATTPPHQDHFYIRGSVETYSCWIPLGACPMSLGALAVWPGSHHQGFLEHGAHHPGAVGGYGVPVDDAQVPWHCSDFEIGDALFFHAFTVHKALPNLSGDTLRLSTDNRYQRREDDIHPGALRPHYDLN